MCAIFQHKVSITAALIDVVEMVLCVLISCFFRAKGIGEQFNEQILRCTARDELSRTFYQKFFVKYERIDLLLFRSLVTIIDFLVIIPVLCVQKCFYFRNNEK